MLSDKFLKDEDYLKTSDLSKQISRLEELSISMSNLIESGNSQKIVHLEKVRKKILKDILKKKEPISDELRPKFSNIIDINTKLILKTEEQKKKTLQSIKKKINFYESYKDL
tara:strand:+ start:142 stop:477 length:336 start_codon:yes stop_codon:yes gene_type:complete